MIIKDKNTVQYLNDLVKRYDGITKEVSAAKTRMAHLNPDAIPKNDDIVTQMEKIKNKLSRMINRQLEYWPIWTEWMSGVPGCGATIGARLITLFYYRFDAVCDCGGRLEKVDKAFVCADCGKKARGEGVLKHDIGFKHFANISKWWAYMGMHTVDGMKPRRAKGKVANWSTQGRTACYHLGDQFVKQGGKYREFYDMRKKKREKTHPEASKGHRHAMAKNETAKLFLAHMWTVDCYLRGVEPTKPYAGTIMGHTGIIDPFYYDIPERNERLAA